MSDLQINILRAADDWAIKEKTPIPLQYIVASVSVNDQHVQIAKDTIKGGIRALVKSGYLRKAVRRTNVACYVLLRNI